MPPKTDLRAALKRTSPNAAGQDTKFDRADQGLSAFHAAPALAPNTPGAKTSVNLPPPVTVVRDSFTFPADEYALIAAVQQKLIGEGIVVNKGEVVRLGLQLLDGLKVESLAKTAKGLRQLKPGRK